MKAFSPTFEPSTLSQMRLSHFTIVVYVIINVCHFVVQEKINFCFFHSIQLWYCSLKLLDFFCWDHVTSSWGVFKRLIFSVEWLVVVVCTSNGLEQIVNSHLKEWLITTVPMMLTVHVVPIEGFV